MVNSKKLLSLFLAVVMILSTFAVMASAYTVGPERAGDINYKYTVEKVGTVPANEAAGSEEYTADNIYAVTVWAKCDGAMMNLTMPVHYNKAHFAPIVLVAEGMTFPIGAEMDPDTYYSDMGEGSLYAYSFGDYMNNTGMYKANGDTASSKALAKCIGLGNSNSAGIDVMAEFLSPDHSLYAKWSAGLPENTGIMYANIKVTGKTKTAYFNTIEGITTNTDWNRMFTFYFETLPGVTDADVVGDVFGVYTEDAFTVDGTTDTAGYGYFVNATTTKVGNPNKNIVENAVVAEAAAPSIVNPLKGQIRFHKDAGEYAGSFDVRALAVITADDFGATFGDIATAKDMITEIGFVFAQGATVTAPSMDDVKDVIASCANGEGKNGYLKKTVNYISTSVEPGSYVFSCIATDITDDDYENSLVAVGYIAYEVDGETVYAYYPAAQTISFAELFDAQYDNAFPA